MKNLTTKLVRVMAQVKRVAKNGRNDFHNYDYVTEADILEAVRENLIKENIFVFASVIGSHRDGDLTSVQVQNTIVDADSGESMVVTSLGQGQDKGDKGANKAITAASKYFFMKNFLIPTGDDSEASDENGKSTSRTKTSKSQEITEGGESSPKKYGFSNKKVANLKTTPTEGTSNGIF